MKYENTVMFVFLSVIILLFTIITIQAFELQHMQEERNFYFQNYYNLLNFDSSNTDSFIIQEFSDYQIISDDGLRIEHELSPRIEKVR